MTSVERFDIVGYRVCFASNSALAADLVRKLYGTFSTQDASPSELFVLQERNCGSCDSLRFEMHGRRTVSYRSLRGALDRFEWEICHRVLARRHDLVALHAATIVTPSGPLLLMGASGMGKSTLAVALTLHGCRVAGDDVVLLDPSNGSVIAAPRCIHLDARSQRLLRGLGLQLPEAAVTGGFLSAGDFGTGRLPFQKARHLILLEGKDNRRPRLEPLTQAEMTALLFDPSRSTGLTAAERLDALVTLVSGTQCHRLVKGNLTETLSLLASRFCPPRTPIGNDRMRQTLECSET